MSFLAFFQASPGILSGLPIYLITTFMFFRRSRIQSRIALNFLIGIGIIFVLVLTQSILRNQHATIVAMVSDQAFREAITKGTYSMEKGVDWVSFLRMFVIASATLMLTAVVNRGAQQEKYISHLCYFAVASFVFLFFLAHALGADQSKAILAPLTSLETNNYLTSDRYGYRISGFFHEPSHASVFFGTTVAAFFVLRGTVVSRVWAIVILFLIFLMSRSVSVLAEFIVALFFLYAPKFAALAALISSAMLQVLLKIVAERYSASGLFRSVYERSFNSEIYNATTLDRLLGFDFGEVYSFEPIFGLTLQIGILGLVGLYFILQRDVRTFGFFVFSFTLVPQLWYYPAWGAVSVFMIALHAKEMSAKGLKGGKNQNRNEVNRTPIKSALAY